MVRLLKHLAVLIAAGGIPYAYADGIPVSRDLKSVTQDHYTIVLTASQVPEVERLRTITMTDEQLRPLHAVYEKFPRTVEVVSSRWDSCTCGMGAYAIWCRPGEVYIPWYSAETQEAQDEYDAANPAEEEPDAANGDGRVFIEFGIKIDSQGLMYLDGKAVFEEKLMELVEEAVVDPNSTPPTECFVYLDIPPPIDDETDARIRELSERIGVFCKERRVNFWALGISSVH
jgi:hypothetical protein